MITGSCHCGDVRWKVTAWPDWLTVCNCTYCRKAGALWGEVDPETTELTARTPQQDYVFGDRTLTIHRCAHCGITTHWTSREPAIEKRMKINFTTARDLAPPDIRVRHFDGADSWEYLD
ncbi:GFA family protein [Hyphobacterium sp.]|jgi:hypothetical protein|uniref:GFA family protein n=1 Tax=Hyphobacterium sp. TaxID=2004662 RepID=UPI003BAD58D1